VLQDGSRLDVLVGRLGKPFRTYHLNLRGQAVDCGVTDHDVAVAASVGGGTSLELARASGHGRPSISLVPQSVETAQFCAGTVDLVTVGGRGAMIQRPGQRIITVAGAQLDGCTADGSTWFVRGRSISWVGGSSSGR
jgi:hypothetical protein